jgi:hypothetical protein
MRWLPTSVAIGVGIVVLADFFFNHPILDALGVAFQEWAIILTAFALLLGLINLFNVHLTHIVRRNDPGHLGESGAGYSAIVLLTATGVTVIGMLWGLASAPMTWIFENMYVPLQSAFFALIAFFLATAGYRALRARNLETLLMLVAALIVFVGQTPWLNLLSDAKEWVLRVPAEAGVRGILMGVALGTIATGLRLIVGLDRPYSE